MHDWAVANLSPIAFSRETWRMSGHCARPVALDVSTGARAQAIAVLGERKCSAVDRFVLGYLRHSLGRLSLQGNRGFCQTPLARQVKALLAALRVDGMQVQVLEWGGGALQYARVALVFVNRRIMPMRSNAIRAASLAIPPSLPTVGAAIGAQRCT